jgi:hypothetical protein
MFVWEGLRNCAAGNCMAPRTPRDFCHNPHNVRKGAICRRAADTSLESLLLRLVYTRPGASGRSPSYGHRPPVRRSWARLASLSVVT